MAQTDIVPAARAQVLAAERPAVDGQYLTFSLQGEIFGLEILRVREIIGYTQPTEIPLMPAFVHGVINLRGSVVPVIDLAQRLGRGATELKARTCIVIVEVDAADAAQPMGILVDAVDAVLDIGADAIEPAPAFGSGLRAQFIRGMARREQGFIVLLDVGRVFALDELAALARGVETAEAQA